AGEKAAERAKNAAEHSERAPRREGAPKGDRPDRPAKPRRRPEADKPVSISEDTGVTLGDLFGGIKLDD
ncbi:MAG: 30S ribosomal protein S1, partial [Pyramidobacter sp.]|nr:30S ribosomal protein S1 [Pyramidobacter sp.]